jgi:predicted rRNA methylase YqxC with S4 and FtsJ domains
MNITSPQEMTSGTSKVEEAVSKFEEQFAKDEKDQQHYHLVIVGEYNRQTCDEVEKIYSQAGWQKVKCRTSSENGERGGLTGLQLYRS